MKAIKLANGNMKIVISRNEWEKMGKEAGWGDILKTVVSPLVKPIQKVFEPEKTNPYLAKEDGDGSAYHLTGEMEERNIINTPSNLINVNDLARLNASLHIGDPDLIMALDKAIAFISNPPKETNPKVVGGLKVAVYRIVKLPKGNTARRNAEEVIKKWRQQQIASERFWEKPKNPYA